MTEAAIAILAGFALGCAVTLAAVALVVFLNRVAPPHADMDRRQ